MTNRMINFKLPRESVEQIVSVVLRVPALFIFEVWFRIDPKKTIQMKTKDMELIVTVMSYIALLLGITMVTLPLKRLVTLYMYMVSGLLIALSHQLSFSFIQTEQNAMSETADFQRLVFHIGIQCVIAASVSYLIEIRDWTKFTTLLYTLPVFARLSGLSGEGVRTVHNISSFLTLVMCTFFMFNKLGYVLEYLKHKLTKVTIAVRAVGWLSVFITLWHRISLPTQLVVFWCILFASQLYSYVHTEASAQIRDNYVIMTLLSIGDSCATPISLIGLCVSISYISYCVLTLTKIFLQGWSSFNHDNRILRGWDEGFTMLLIAVQTEFLTLQPLERAFLMSILLFIIVSSLLQSMYEVTEPILLALSAANSRDLFKHARTLCVCTFLWIFPLYMTKQMCNYFELDFMLLVILTNCLITSVQVLSSLVIYSLFIYDSFQPTTWERLDDVIYYTKASTRVIEFIVAVIVVVYGVKESILGKWSWINSSILIVHCYVNIWKRLQAGWKSFLLRREAVRLVARLPDASMHQLVSNSDVCPICYEELSQAKVTPCLHFFHNHCLKKWLYVKDTCPMCHHKLPSADALQQGSQSSAAGQPTDAPVSPPP